jgi:ELWxxDGT repeat protein
MLMSSAGPGPANLRAIDGMLYFAASDERGVEPWRSDGTPEGTVRLADVAPLHGGLGDSGPAGFIQLGPDVLFAADDGAHGRELWSLPLATPLPISLPLATPLPGSWPRPMLDSRQARD